MKPWSSIQRPEPEVRVVLTAAVHGRDADLARAAFAAATAGAQFLGAVALGVVFFGIAANVQQGSCAASVSGQARAAAKPGITAASSSAWALAMPSSSFARTPLMVVCFCSALYSSIAT